MATLRGREDGGTRASGRPVGGAGMFAVAESPSCKKRTEQRRPLGRA